MGRVPLKACYALLNNSTKHESLVPCPGTLLITDYPQTSYKLGTAYSNRFIWILTYLLPLTFLKKQFPLYLQCIPLYEIHASISPTTTFEPPPHEDNRHSRHGGWQAQTWIVMGPPGPAVIDSVRASNGRPLLLVIVYGRSHAVSTVKGYNTSAGTGEGSEEPRASERIPS